MTESFEESDSTQQPATPETHQSSLSEDDGSFARLFRRIALLSSGATLSHAILLGCSPILMRLYEPADFAVYGFYQAVLSILSIGLTLQFEQAIALTKSDHDAHTLHRMIVRLGVGLCLFLTIGVVAIAAFGLLKFSWLTPLIVFILPACALGEAYTRTHRMDAVRYAHFRPIAMSRLTMSITVVTGQILLAVAGLRGVGLALGDGVGRWLSAIPLYLGNRKHRQSHSQKKPTATMTQLAKTYSKFPLLLTPAAMVTLLIVMGPALILPGLYGEDFAGQFNLANRCVLLPMMIISQAVTHVFMSDAARMIREKNTRLTSLMFATMKRLTLIGTGMALVAAISAPFLFPILFGSQWVVAGNIVPVVAVAGLAQFVCGPIIQVLILMQEEKQNLLIRVFGAIAILGSIYGAHAVGGTPTQAVVAFVVAMCLFGAVSGIQAFRSVDSKTKLWKTELTDPIRIPLAA